MMKLGSVRQLQRYCSRVQEVGRCFFLKGFRTAEFQPLDFLGQRLAALRWHPWDWPKKTHGSEDFGGGPGLSRMPVGFPANRFWQFTHFNLSVGCLGWSVDDWMTFSTPFSFEIVKKHGNLAGTNIRVESRCLNTAPAKRHEIIISEYIHVFLVHTIKFDQRWWIPWFCLANFWKLQRTFERCPDSSL